MRASHSYLAPTVEIIDRVGLPAFVASRKVVILLLGSTSPRAFLLPIMHHFARRFGGDVGFGYVAAEELWQRAGLLPLVRGAFQGEQNRPRAARRGYYIFLRGQVIGFHLGVNDPSFTPYLDPILRAISAQKHNSEMLRRFQHAVQSIAMAVIARFEPLIFSGGASAPVRSARTDPYQVLGLSPVATDAEVKRAYRSKLRESHPDLVATLSAEIRQAAVERSQRIIRAYTRIAESRKLRQAPAR